MALFLVVAAVGIGCALSSPSPAPEMVTIPGGSFGMGDSFGDGDSGELPVHTVAVSAFTMDEFEVTKALWDEVAGWAAAHGYDIGPEDGSSGKAAAHGYDIGPAAGEGKAAAHPVTDVTWYEAVKWANARSEKEGLEPCYAVSGSVYRTEESGSPDCNWNANGYRLPTEAEWEKAARGGAEGHRFPWSAADTRYPLSGADTIDFTRARYSSERDWFYDTNSELHFQLPSEWENDPLYRLAQRDLAERIVQQRTVPVGGYEANGYGLFDMAGNVWEWCWDWYSRSYYESSEGSDPRGTRRQLGPRRGPLPRRVSHR